MTTTSDEAKAQYLSSEFTNTIEQINLNKKLGMDATKLYFLIFFALFAYTSFIVTNNANPLYVKSYGLFGIALTIATSIAGAVLIDYITSLVYKTILYYKHIYTLRECASEHLFENNFINHIIFDKNPSVITTERSKQLPIAFITINLLLLGIIYFFMIYSKYSVEISLLFTYIIILIFSILLPNACQKLEEEKNIAGLISANNTNENIIRIKIKKIKNKKKQTIKFKILNIFYILTIILTLITFVYIYNGMYANILLKIDILLISMVLLMRYRIANIHINNIIKKSK